MGEEESSLFCVFGLLTLFFLHIREGEPSGVRELLRVYLTTRQNGHGEAFIGEKQAVVPHVSFFALVRKRRFTPKESIVCAENRVNPLRSELFVFLARTPGLGIDEGEREMQTPFVVWIFPPSARVVSSVARKDGLRSGGIMQGRVGSEDRKRRLCSVAGSHGGLE